MTLQVNIHEAKTHLSRLLERVRTGDEIIIAKVGKPVARLVPFLDKVDHRMPGSAAGKIQNLPILVAASSNVCRRGTI